MQMVTVSFCGLNNDELHVQIASDLHLEMLPKDFCDWPLLIKPSAPVLALLGDISRPSSAVGYALYERLLVYCATHFELVLLIAGNHEYYGKHPMTEVQDKMRQLCASPMLPRLPAGGSKVHFLHSDVLNINGVVVLGTTLWSALPTKAVQDVVGGALNDYTRIYVADPHAHDAPGWQRRRLILPRETNELHEREAAWLGSELKKNNNNAPMLVLTHHTPSFHGTSAPCFGGTPDFDKGHNLTSCGFSSAMDHMIVPPIQVWAYGHTHYTSSQDRGPVLLISNQRGYPDEVDPKYRPDCVVTLRLN